jgi:hypothetical protein
MRYHGVGLILIVVAAPLAAQELTTDIGIRSIGTPQVTLADRIDAALALPLRTADLRAVGVRDTSIRRLFEVMEARNLPTAEQVDILTAARDAVREGKPHAGFASFVQRRLDAGVRGPALAREIHDERIRRTPDSMAAEELAFGDAQPVVSQLPDPAHARLRGSAPAHHARWGTRP